MTKWLASVQSLEEAKTLLPALPDILDMKDPSTGALAALPVSAVKEIVAMIDGRCLSSATVGDLPMQADVISKAMIVMASSNVDYIKIGLFPDEDLNTCVQDLENVVKKLKIPVIAVLFADKSIDLDIIPLLKTSGFHGVMADTALKNGQNLLDHWNTKQLTTFIDYAQQYNMLCGLAGALKFEDIAVLKPLNADYLGFRSALCNKQQREENLQLAASERIKKAIKG